MDLNPATSPIAVFGTLYGNGLREMLRNLLYNPQIQMLLICGNDRSGSFQELWNFFYDDLEPVQTSLVRYISPPGIDKVSPCRIYGTNRVIDDLVRKEHFPDNGLTRGPILSQLLGDLREEETLNRIKTAIESFHPKSNQPKFRGKEIPLPQLEVQYFPSNPRGHVVVRDTIIEAWKEVLYLLTRFGRRVTLKKGDRLELQHVKVVVEKPRFEAEEELQAVNLDPREAAALPGGYPSGGTEAR